MLESNLEHVTQLLTNAFFQLLNYAYESKDHVYNCQRGTLFFHNLLKQTNKLPKVGESLAVATATIAHRMKTFFALVPQKVKAG